MFAETMVEKIFKFRLQSDLNVNFILLLLYQFFMRGISKHHGTNAHGIYKQPLSCDLPFLLPCPPLNIFNLKFLYLILFFSPFHFRSSLFRVPSFLSYSLFYPSFFVYSAFNLPLSSFKINKLPAKPLRGFMNLFHLCAKM